MSHQLSHWFEKFIVEIVTAAAIAGGYFLLYPAIRADGGQEALVFLSTGGLVRAAIFAAAVVALSAACAVLTIRARPVSAMVAALLGAGAASLRSPKLASVAWLQQDGYAALLSEMILELLLLGLVLACAVAVAGRVRSAVSAIRPQWAWRPPQVGPSPGQAGRTAPPRRSGAWGQSALSAGLALFLGIALVTVLLQSSDRGQIVFGILIAFAAGALLAHRLLPGAHAWAYLASPLVAGVLFYALALAGSYGPGPQSWMELPLYAQPLPVDWLTAGGGGAAAGLWISQRMGDSRAIEAAEAALKGLKGL